jgi:hypothetical protein
MTRLEDHEAMLKQWREDFKNPDLRCKDCNHMVLHELTYGCYIQGNGVTFVPRGRHRHICGFFSRRIEDG